MRTLKLQDGKAYAKGHIATMNCLPPFVLYQVPLLKQRILNLFPPDRQGNSPLNSKQKEMRFRGLAKRSRAESNTTLSYLLIEAVGTYARF